MKLFTHIVVHERMLESYALARERFLKPGGLMLPTTGSIVLGPLSDEILYNEQLSTYDNALFITAHVLCTMSAMKEYALTSICAQISTSNIEVMRA